MQVLTTQCPYCQHEVDSTIEHLDGPVVCPSCEKPFEMEMPTAVVTSVHEVDEKTAHQSKMASEPAERTLVEVHPVVFRARPITSIGLAVVGIAAAALIIMSITGISLAGYSLGETMVLGPASIVVWLGTVALLVIAGMIGYWTLLSPR